MKAQVSTEYLLVNAALLTLIILMAAVAYNSIFSLSETKEINIARAALEKIYVNGLSTYYQGDGAKRKVVVQIPAEANLFFSSSDNVLYFTVGETQVSKKFDYPIDVKEYPSFGGGVKFEIKNENGIVEIKAED